MADTEEQGACIKFCFKLGKIAKETFKMLKLTFKDETIS
jgi:hypothetical protein